MEQEQNDCRTIRKLTEDEICGARTLIVGTFTRFVAPRFTVEGVENFLRMLYGDPLLRSADFYGIFEGDLQGVLAYQSGTGHICAFFVRDGQQGRGYGGALMRWFLEHVAAAEITVNASPYARPVYERFGFVATEGLQHRDGMVFYPMRRTEAAQR